MVWLKCGGGFRERYRLLGYSDDMCMWSKTQALIVFFCFLVFKNCVMFVYCYREIHNWWLLFSSLWHWLNFFFCAVLSYFQKAKERNVPLTHQYPPCYAPLLPPACHVYVEYTFFRAHFIFPSMTSIQDRKALHACATLSPKLAAPMWLAGLLLTTIHLSLLNPHCLATKGQILWLSPNMSFSASFPLWIL